MVETASVAATLGDHARRDNSPGTRGKMMAMLRGELLKAQDYAKKQDVVGPESRPARDLHMEMLARVLKGEVPLMITANRAQDIANALRLQEEFKFKLWLDMAAESYLVADKIKAAGIPVFVHPTMFRAFGETENLSFETASKLRAAGIPIALQSGFEDYVPKNRVVLFEAGVAAANGLTFEQALGTITIDAAKILGIDKRVGSLEVGKDGDIAMYDGDPFEYTTHCVGVIIDGKVVSELKR
jgi:imidazolonepropionase-like amidohydrolase